MKPIFFYGLFMDRALLTGQGLNPKGVGPARLSDYRIHVGARATLIPSPGRRALGVVMELTDEEAGALYSEPSVRAYVPEPVRAELLDSGKVIDAVCYNLPPELAMAGTNPEYAARLAELSASLGFEPSYIREIAAFAEGTGL